MSPCRHVFKAAAFLLLFICLLQTALSRSVTSSYFPPDIRDDATAIRKLLRLFGMEQPGRRERHAAPPQFMLDLYDAIADSRGITKSPNPYHANIVRSFPNKDLEHPMRFHFNMTPNVPEKERILEAELHLYKIKPKPRMENRHSDSRSHLLEVRLYQVMLPETANKEEGNKLLATRRISVHSVGWEVFYVKPTVLDWLRGGSQNLGFLISARTMTGEVVRNGVLRFAKRHQHHVNKQPLLVLFNEDGRPRKGPKFPSFNFRSYGYPELARVQLGISNRENWNLNIEDGEEDDMSSSLARAERSVDDENVEREEDELITQAEAPEASSSSLSNDCTRNEMYVDFEKIGWSRWIISPKGYHAYYCRGECSFPLGQNQYPTNHATVQSIVQVLTPGVGDPCCVPNKLRPVSVLYFDEHQNVILKQYDNMVAESCGCQ
ncbi:bone morphogenetic protein 2-like [Limulus polyphemus]|uniref:Bone morphogenetic protein 2-like n=1 Tax=Limulus polyphemus TaxID=6850 RepID=A0ABM1SYA9_LIMPO|nr:bone morphogenetic protein 2-like [Limulus polyphemus]